MALTVVGIFDNATQAQEAIEALVNNGISRNAIDLSATRTSETTSGTSSSGAIIPDRHANTSGTMAEEVVDDTKDVGSSVGNFFSSLFGVDDDDNRQKYATVADQGSVVTVHAQTEDEAERAADILDDNGAVDVDERAAQYGYAGNTNTTMQSDMNRPVTTDGDQTIQVIEENLSVGKQTVQTGGVRLRSRVVSRPVEEHIRLREERVIVQRNPVDRTATDADFNTFKEGEVTLTEQAERAVVAKEARVVEEVTLGKQVDERDEVIHDTVRKTEVDVEQLGTTDKTVRSTGTGTDTNDVTYSTN